MGTSSSNPGPTNKSPLLPPWVEESPPPAPPARFREFRTNLGNWAKSGNQEGLKQALGSYTRKGYGGSSNATKRLSAVASTGGRLHAVLSELANGGDGSQTLGKSLGDLDGISVNDFIEILIDAVVPGFGTIDEELIRQGLDQALSNCLQADVFTPDSLTHDMLFNLYAEFISEEVSNRIISDSKFALNNSNNPVQRENELREYVQSTVDVVIGPKFDTESTKLDASSFESLINEVIAEIFDSFARN